MTPANMGDAIGSSSMDPRFRGDDDLFADDNGPFAGMTICSLW